MNDTSGSKWTLLNDHIIGYLREMMQFFLTMVVSSAQGCMHSF